MTPIQGAVKAQSLRGAREGRTGHTHTSTTCGVHPGSQQNLAVTATLPVLLGPKGSHILLSFSFGLRGLVTWKYVCLQGWREHWLTDAKAFLCGTTVYLGV